MKTKLFDLRTEKGLFQKDVAKECGIKERTYASYENGTNEPPLTALCIFADFFGVSVDKILGRVPEQQLFDDARVSQPEIMRLYNVMNELQQIELVSYARGMLARAASSADEQNYPKKLRA